MCPTVMKVYWVVFCIDFQGKTFMKYSATWHVCYVLSHFFYILYSSSVWISFITRHMKYNSYYIVCPTSKNRVHFVLLMSVCPSICRHSKWIATIILKTFYYRAFMFHMLISILFCIKTVFSIIAGKLNPWYGCIANYFAFIKIRPHRPILTLS